MGLDVCLREGGEVLFKGPLLVDLMEIWGAGLGMDDEINRHKGLKSLSGNFLKVPFY